MITHQQVLDAALKYRGSNKKNPIHGPDDGRCVYTSQDGKEHCIAGQIAVDLGGDAPPYGAMYGLSDNMKNTWEEHTGVEWSAQAFRLLTMLQSIADNTALIDDDQDNPVSGPTPWGKVIAHVITGLT